MSNKRRGTTVYILGNDPVTTESQRFLLEFHRYRVETIDSWKPETSYKMCENDIFLADVDDNSHDIFYALNSILMLRYRPKLLITTAKKFVFEHGDKFVGVAFEFLFKPFRPDELITAIDQLNRAEFTREY